MDRLAIKPTIAPSVSPMVAPIPVPTPITKIDPSDLNLDRDPNLVIKDDPFGNNRKPWELIPGKDVIKFPEQEPEQPKSNKLLLVAGVALLLLALK